MEKCNPRRREARAQRPPSSHRSRVMTSPPRARRRIRCIQCSSQSHGPIARTCLRATLPAPDTRTPATAARTLPPPCPRHTTRQDNRTRAHSHSNQRNVTTYNVTYAATMPCYACIIYASRTETHPQAHTLSVSDPPAIPWKQRARVSE